MADPIIPREFRGLSGRSLTRSLAMIPVAVLLLIVFTFPFSCTTVTDYEVAVLKNPITGNVADGSTRRGRFSGRRARRARKPRP